MNPFTIREKLDPSFLQALFRKQPRFNAIIEINNLLASKPLKEVLREEVESIAATYKINIKHSYRNYLQDLYAYYLSYCFEDRKFTDSEISDLKHLKTILLLTDEEILEVNHQVGFRIYSEEIEKALEDGRLSPEEKKFLQQLVSTFNLPEEITQSIYSSAATSYVNQFFTSITADQRISKREEWELVKMADSLGIDISLDEKARDTYDKMKYLGAIEEGRIPEIKVNLPLLPGEACYFKTQCRYALLTTEMERDTQEMTLESGLEVIEKGIVLLTNRRLVFIGEKKSRNFHFNNIEHYSAHHNGISITAKGESTKCFLFDENIEIFSAIYRRMSGELPK